MTRSLRAAGFGLALAIATVSSAAAKITLSEKTIHYTVGGRTGKDIYGQIARRGPLLRGEGGHKVATTTLEFDIRKVRPGLRGNRCVILDVEVHVDVVFRIPRWSGKGSRAVRKAWSDFEAHLWRHERRHRDIALEYARRVERDILGLVGDARSECAGMTAQAERLARTSRAWHDRKQRAFDASWYGDGGQQFKYDRALMASR